MSENETFKSLTNEKQDHTFVGSFETELLRAVSKAKLLYCSHDPNYNNVAKNRLEWSQIAERCKKTVPECVRKWHSLLRIYFSSSPNIVWVHFQDFQKFEPYLSNHRIQNVSQLHNIVSFMPETNPSRQQTIQLLGELWKNSSDFRKPESTPEKRQNIWYKIVFQCNTVTPGVIMSIINWQKFWLMVKQRFGTRLYTLMESQKKNENVPAKYSQAELKIMEICRVSPLDSIGNIITALGKNVELGTNKEIVVRKCKKCLQQPDEILYQGCCSKCCEKPNSCEICDIGEPLVKYKLKDWSKQALDLLPVELVFSQEISICTKCADKLKSEATVKWKICRICEANKTSCLYNLYSESFDNLRKDFSEATKLEFSEKDGLPGYICKLCNTRIQTLNGFVKKIKQTQSRLMYIQFVNFIGSTPDQPEKQHYEDKIQSTVASEDTGIIRNPPISSVPIKVIPNNKFKSYKIIPSPSRKSKNIDRPAESSSHLAIQGDSSLQQSNQDTKLSKSGVIVLEPKRVLNGRKLVSQPVQSNQNLNENRHIVSKTVGIFPSKQSITAKTTTLPSRTAKPQELVPLLQKSRSNITVESKTIAASKPAIFTIFTEPLSGSDPGSTPITTTETDYEAIEDAPPVFCIPKNVNEFPSKAYKQFMDFNPIRSPSTVVVKTEKVDVDYNYTVEENPRITSSNYSIVKTEPSAGQLNLIKNPLLKNENSLKLSTLRNLRMRGDLINRKQHPYISNPFVPGEKRQILESGGQIRLKSQTLTFRKVNIAKDRLHIAKPINISHTFQAKTGSLERQGIKKRRKYWGTVDEFQIAPLTAKAEFSAAMTRLCENSNQTQKDIQLVDSSDAGRESLCIQHPLKTGIKEEIPDNNYAGDTPVSYQNQDAKKNSSEYLKLKSIFKLKKLRVNIKRDKRVQIVDNKSKNLCLKQSIAENCSILSPHEILLTYEKLRELSSKKKIG